MLTSDISTASAQRTAGRGASRPLPLDDIADGGRTYSRAMRELDHLVLAGPHLPTLVADFERLTGVRPAPGGRHSGLGTANHLVGLGGAAYLELIGPDPDGDEPERPRPFGIDALTEATLVTWAIRPIEFDERIATARSGDYEPGSVRSMSRRTADGDLLRWRLTVPDDGHGLVPFLIDWGSTPHPASGGLPEVALTSLSATHPSPSDVLRALDVLGADLEVVPGTRAGLRAVVHGLYGPVVLS
ncbi:VOC family protein [Umezawaea beigongshangensis]|uniref:VOC family protein n=1 Tax=Umezawaea beigongshangensis TaxID=2780383 RepID=UPI0027DE95F6|nr:VOC family protein [Umezawaea beigongshangensis]